MLMVRNELRFQPVDSTHQLNRSAGIDGMQTALLSSLIWRKLGLLGKQGFQ